VKKPTIGIKDALYGDPGVRGHAVTFCGWTRFGEIHAPCSFSTDKRTALLDAAQIFRDLAAEADILAANPEASEAATQTLERR